MPKISPGPLLPQPLPKNKSGGGGGGSGGKKGIFVGVIYEGPDVEVRRAFVRFKISDLPSAVPSVRLEWRYVNKTQPTGNVALIEIDDFTTLDPADWGIAERGTINAEAITPETAIDTRLSLDVTTAYNQAKTDGRAIFALKLQYDTEDEGVGAGRWYEVGATGDFAPKLVLTITAGKDLAFTLLATPMTVDLARVDDLGAPAATMTAGEGVTFPPLGAEVRLGASIVGLQDDALGTYTGVPSTPITRGCDIIRFLWQSADEGCGIAAHLLDVDGLLTSRGRLATGWFALAGGLTQFGDVRDWVAEICRAIRSITYLDQQGREAIHTDPLDSSGSTPIRLVRPDEHGPLSLFPLQTEGGSALYPISRVSVYYGFDYLGLEETGWKGHALLSAEETAPADTERQAQAAEAETRYGIRALGDEEETAGGETSYPWVPMEAPGAQTGVLIRNWEWDRARARPLPAHGLEVALPRFALAWRLLDEFEIESYAFPSAAARVLPTATPILGSTGPGPLAYQCRRARCVVREIPRLLAESGSEFPVQVIAQIVAWDTP